MDGKRKVEWRMWNRGHSNLTDKRRDVSQWKIKRFLLIEIFYSSVIITRRKLDYSNITYYPGGRRVYLCF